MPGLQELFVYANEHLARCPIAPEKPACTKYPIYCGKLEMRERILRVMQFSG